MPARVETLACGLKDVVLEGEAWKEFKAQGRGPRPFGKLVSRVESSAC